MDLFNLNEEVKTECQKKKKSQPRNKSEKMDTVSAYVPNMVKMTFDMLAKQNSTNTSKILAFIIEKIAIECLEKGFDNVEYLKGFKDGN